MRVALEKPEKNVLFIRLTRQNKDDDNVLEELFEKSRLGKITDTTITGKKKTISLLIKNGQIAKYY